MYILALDSTAGTASVALCDDATLLGESTLQNGNTHSENLLPMVEELLDKFSLTPRDIDLFACTIGPGSFTGVRIGAATLKGLAFASGKPCVGVSTLASLARNLEGFGHDLPAGAIICPVMNARRQQVYNALFRISGGLPERMTEDRAISIEALETELLARNAPVYLVGDGYEITLRGLSRLTVRETPIRLRTQSAASTAFEALDLYRAGKVTDDQGLMPIYLRPCQAERERLAREATQSTVNQ